MGLNIFGIEVEHPLANTDEAIINAVPESLKPLIAEKLKNGLSPETLTTLFSGPLIIFLEITIQLVNAYQKQFLRNEQFNDLLNQQALKKNSDVESRQALEEIQIIERDRNRLKARQDMPTFIFQILFSEGTIESLKEVLVSHTAVLLDKSQDSERLIQKLYEKDQEIEHNDTLYDAHINDNKIKNPNAPTKPDISQTVSLSFLEEDIPTTENLLSVDSAIDERTATFNLDFFDTKPILDVAPPLIVSRNPLRLRPSERQLAVGDMPIVVMPHVKKSDTQYSFDIGNFQADELRIFSIKNSAFKNGFTFNKAPHARSITQKACFQAFKNAT